MWRLRLGQLRTLCGARAWLSRPAAACRCNDSSSMPAMARFTSESRNQQDGPHLPLVCLHMSPKSGRQYANFMAVMGTDRIVVAPDYPGYGESAPPPAEPAVTIEDYAAVVFEALAELGIGQADLFGFHTGAEVAAEMARREPERVRRLILVSAPILEPDELAALRQDLRADSARSCRDALPATLGECCAASWPGDDTRNDGGVICREPARRRGL